MISFPFYIIVCNYLSVGFRIIYELCAPFFLGLRKGPYRCIPNTPLFFYLNLVIYSIAFSITSRGEDISVGKIKGVPYLQHD